MNLIDIETPLIEIENLLAQKGWISNESILKIEIPGEGNMNVVLKVTTEKRIFILKQSRPYVNKYQQIDAPLERIITEYQFFGAIKGSPLKNHVPSILAFDSSDYLMMIEYIQDFEDMVQIYGEQKIPDQELTQLVQILGEIHRSKNYQDYPANKALRELNHQHIFVLPFLEDNGFQLDDVQVGLQELSKKYKQDQQLKNIIEQIGQLYLSKGDCLIHGDYYPGSWMRTNDNVYAIDAEFSFIGFKEFDLGVMIAHLMMATLKKDYLDQIITKYSDPVDMKLVKQVAGIEIMRRLIGLAQLPLTRSIEEKKNLLEIASQLITE